MKKHGNIFTFICLVLVVGGASRLLYSWFQLKEYGESTVGIVADVKVDKRHREELLYHFRVAGKTYQGRSLLKSNHHYNPGDTVRIRFSARNPEVNEVSLRN